MQDTGKQDSRIAGSSLRLTSMVVRLVTPQTSAFVSALIRCGAAVTGAEGGGLNVAGMTPAQIGDLATRDRLTIHELVPVLASLEDAFMELTQDAVEYRSPALVGSTSGGK